LFFVLGGRWSVVEITHHASRITFHASRSLMEQRLELRDKVIVITGASSGFGEAIARRCAAGGAKVVLAARSAGALEQLAGALGRERVLAVPTDITNSDDVARLVEAALGRFGQVDVLVANAGFGVLDRFAQARLDDLREMVDVNVYGTVRCVQAFLPHMLERRCGHIVVMASLAGVIASVNMGFYSATKFALVGMARTLMLELHGSGVRCALICPGVAPTGFQLRADRRKYPRITRLVQCSAEQVADATVRAIRDRTHGEMIIPWRARLLAVAAQALPGLARTVMRIVR
jgi:short-subunit dehydrogenase